MIPYCVPQLKGPQYATLDKPPNNDKFDALNPRSLAQKSPLLQHCLQLNEAKNPPPSQQFHNHINIPPEILGLFHAPATAPPPPIIAPHHAVPVLLPPALEPGPKMTIEDFCTNFSLSNAILECLCKNGYSGSHVIQHIEIGELKSMQFLPGEIAELKEAV